VEFHAVVDITPAIHGRDDLAGGKTLPPCGRFARDSGLHAY
jgi:hypothetical protein